MSGKLINTKLIKLNFLAIKITTFFYKHIYIFF